MLEKYNPWVPISNPTDLKVLGKALEECGEYGSALARCLIQGIDEAEPTTGKVNRRWLEEELADVFGTAQHVMEKFSLDQHFITGRANNKYERLQVWFDMPVEKEDE